MAGGKNNTQRIEALESQAANLSSRLAVHATHSKGILDVLKKGAEAAERHTLKITVIEQQLLVLVDLKASLAAIASLDKDVAVLRKEIESLQKWKDDLQKEKDEAARRWWAFGPNISAAVLNSIISLIIALLVVWLNKPR